MNRKNDDMLLQEVSDLLRETQCPQTVDVTDAVMERVQKMPILSVKVPKDVYKYERGRMWRNISVAAMVVAACASVVLVNRSMKYSDSKIGSMLTEVYNYQYDDVASVSLYNEMENYMY